MKAAVFLDKDGTLIENVPFNADPDRVRLTLGAAEGLLRLQRSGYPLVLISNQQGIAHGYLSEDDLARTETRLHELLARAGITLAACFYCIHHPEARLTRYRTECICRKPLPGMLFRAAEELRLDLRASWMIGDILDDIEAGKRAGCRTILLNNGNETEWQPGPYRDPDFLADDLLGASLIIREKDCEEQALASSSDLDRHERYSRLA